jgi:hypothetical protein
MLQNGMYIDFCSHGAYRRLYSRCFAAPNCVEAV